MTTAAAGKTSKMAMVRSAIDTLGKFAKPADLVTWVKRTYSEDISPAMVSNYKGMILGGGTKAKKVKDGTTAKAGKPGRRPGRPAGSKNRATKTPTARAAKPSRPPATADATVSVEVIGEVKRLVLGIGPSNVKSLVDLLSN